jgi:hypothetical protein
MGVSVKGKVVGEGGTGVALGMGVRVKGKAVWVNGSVGYGVAVLPGNGVPGIGVGEGVRVAMLGTQSISPGKIWSLDLQFTDFSNPAVV